LTNWVEISKERLLHNYGVLTRAAGAETTLLAVIKANAYGHGVERCARVLAEGGVEWLGVTGVEEGSAVRRALSAAGIAVDAQPRVLVMSGISEEDAEAIVLEDLTSVIWSLAQAGWLQAAAERLGLRTRVPVHVEVDSGMTRQGVRPGAELRNLVRAIQSAKALRVDGVMTHFASAEVAGAGEMQRREFQAALGDFGMEEVSPEWVSVGNTSGIDLVEGPEDLLAWIGRIAGGTNKVMVRAGLGLYGYCLPLEPAAGSGPIVGTVISRLDEELQLVMTWKAKVIGVEDVPAGVAVGYNGTFVTERPMRLALVAAGYADGLRRELSSTNAKAGGWVMLREQRAPIVGRVSMNLTSVDVTGIDCVRLGDDAVLLGDGITADDHARIAGTTAYEILCGVRGVERN
jgi:alanine racemase